jgi:hypothetical protein
MVLTTAAFSQDLFLGSDTIAMNGSTTVDLSITGLTPGQTALGTFDVNVAFDPSILTLESAIYGDPAIGDQLSFNGLALNETTLGGGAVELFELSFDPSATLLSFQPDHFTLATLTFSGLSAGSAMLSLSANAIGDQDGNVITPTLHNGSISVTSRTMTAPEIDASSAASALTLLAGLIVVLGGQPRARAGSS